MKKQKRCNDCGKIIKQRSTTGYCRICYRDTKQRKALERKAYKEWYRNNRKTVLKKQGKYSRSEKGKEARRRYSQSEKAKEIKRKYYQTNKEKIKEYLRKWRENERTRKMQNM